jgi:chorismate mutase
MTTSGGATRDPREDLMDCRNAIEVVDQRIVALLAQRVELGRRAAAAKRDAGLPIVDHVRETEVLRRAIVEARRHDLPADGVEQIFQSILALSRRVQEEGR